MAARIIKVAGLVVLAAALSAPFASAMRLVGDDGGSASTTSTWLNTPALDQGMQATSSATSTWLNTPALDQGMHGTVVAPNDRAGTQGIGQTSDSIGTGGQYGANLIQDAQAAKKRDLQNANSFKLPTSPDRPGTSSVAPALVIPVRPDNRPGTRGVVPPSSGNNTYDVGGVLRNPNAAPTPTAVAAPVSTTGDGFNWGIAGIGAAGLASIALAIGLLVVLGRRSRHEGVAVS
jgi:hypothetical protein